MVNDPFDVDSEVALDLRSVDWARTPLGDPTDWPQSLTTVVRTVLASRFSMWMAWGPELTFFCNDAYRADTLGKKYPWALGRPAREVWAEIWDDIGPRIDSVLDTGQATWDEALLLFLERSGYVEETYHTFSYSPLADDGGDIVGMLCVVTEDTERVIAQRRMELLRNVGAETAMIRDETDFLTAICQQLESDKQTLPFTFIYLYDADETYAELRCATGVPDGSDLAPDLIDLNAPSAWPAADLLEGEALVIGELSARFADVPRGDWPDPPIDALLVPLRVSGQDRPIGFVVTAVNRYRPLDASYRAFIDLLVGQIGTGLSSARAYEAERARADALAALDHAKTTFFTNISHEFRTPLTLLLGPAEDALADADNALNVQQRERIEIINRNGQRLLKLVNTLLDFSRLESDRMTAHFEPVDISAVTTELAGAFRSAVERAGLTLNIDCQPVEAPVFIDREMWAKVVLNLLSNALKFTFEGSITVTVRQIANQVELAVTDTGTGIAPEAIGSLFERFQRVAGARSRSHEGSGIGLALVAELVELHGGIVAATSQVDVGSTFRVVLPTGSEHLPAEQVSMDAVNDIDAARVASGYLAEASRWGEPAGPVTPSEDPNRPSVLVVDDNADMREYVVRLLSTEYAVTWATDGMDALDRIRAAAPDLILTDVMMPRMDGFELLDTLRADPATSDIPVVMLSARAGDDAMVEGLEAGADDYLVKPFTTRELRARVRANLELERVRRARNLAERNRRMLAQAQRLARLGSWEIDVESGVITASEDFYEQLQLTSGIDAGMAMEEVFNRQVHPADREVVIAALAACTTHGTPFDSEFRVQLNDGEWRVLHAIAELERDPEGTPVRVRGSIQDVTERREAEAAIAEAAAAREASEREHRIADQLQRSLLPPSAFRPDHLEIATYYRAGVEGTQVGGDWYDVIELGAGRTALVVGDVMGRGVRAAAEMGQLRAAVRAYARLDLTPTDVLEFLDGVVRDLGEDQIVTCVYCVYDPNEGELSVASAGHLPPLLLSDDGSVSRLGVTGPPLGTGNLILTETVVALPAGATLLLYTDGLVETRARDIEGGIEELAHHLASASPVLEDLPQALVDAMLPNEPDDDVALLVAAVSRDTDLGQHLTLRVEPAEQQVQQVRRSVAEALTRWDVMPTRRDEIVLLTSELVTNAMIHGQPPIELRIRATPTQVILDVRDAATYLPRRLRPREDDEHGRGLQLVSILAQRWGTRPLSTGKSVWCVVAR